MQREAISSLGMLRQFVYKLGPYVMLEALVPGGTLLALLLFLYRGRKLNTRGDARTGAWREWPLSSVTRETPNLADCGQSAMLRYPFRPQARHRAR
jgi:hypothetical protein